MSAKLAIQFAAMAVGATVLAIWIASDIFIRLIFAWIGIAFAVVAAAYASGEPHLLMKRQNGSQPPSAWAVLWPYLLLTRFTFWIYRITHARSTAYAEIIPGLWFSRRMTASEAQKSGLRWHSVLDLAAKFPRAPVNIEKYYSLPMLDAAVPSDAQLNLAVEWIDKQLHQGPLLIHCALGHGRTGCAVLSWLLLHGHVQDVNAGIQRLCALRGGFGVSKAQAARIAHFAADRPAI